MKTTIAQRIREARSFKQLNQGVSPAKIDIATRTVQRWEKGEQVPDSNYLMRIAKSTGVLAHWLLTGEGEMIPTDLHKSKIITLPTSRYKKVTLVSLPLFASVPAEHRVIFFILNMPSGISQLTMCATRTHLRLK